MTPRRATSVAQHTKTLSSSLPIRPRSPSRAARATRGRRRCSPGPPLPLPCPIMSSAFRPMMSSAIPSHLSFTVPSFTRVHSTALDRGFRQLTATGDPAILGTLGECKWMVQVLCTRRGPPLAPERGMAGIGTAWLRRMRV